MESIKEFLKKHKMICDGAFGTYYAQNHPECNIPEQANMDDAQGVCDVHRDYILAGANMIRTNTFSMHTAFGQMPFAARSKYLLTAVAHAKKAVREHATERTVFVAGNIGPAQDNQEYYASANILVSAGVDLLVFESFSELDDILPAINQIHNETGIFILVHFSVDPYGFTETGVPAGILFDRVAQIDAIDAVGLNCAIAPGALCNVLRRLSFPQNKYISAVPNAGFPVYTRDPNTQKKNVAYFKQKMNEISALGVDILGGCCGTVPEHIEAISGMDSSFCQSVTGRAIGDASNRFPDIFMHDFFSQASPAHPVIAAELAPPFDARTDRLMHAAYTFKKMGVDIVTFPDSPSGRTRVDSIAMAIKVFNEVGIKAMPHICCRDKNTVALSAQILGAHVNGLRHFLTITGDPMPVEQRKEMKAVFDFDAVGMMRILSQMNRTDWPEDPIVFGGAVNCGCANMSAEIKRIQRKLNAGARFFFTQPIFSDREIENYLRAKKETGAKIMCGLMVLVSQKNAIYIKNEIQGINISDQIVEHFSLVSDKTAAERVGVGICQDIVRKTRSFADGYYFSIPFFRAHLLKEVLEPFNLPENKVQLDT